MAAQVDQSREDRYGQCGNKVVAQVLGEDRHEADSTRTESVRLVYGDVDVVALQAAVNTARA